VEKRIKCDYFKTRAIIDFWVEARVRRYFLHLAGVLVVKIILVILMAHYLFPKENRIKMTPDLIQHQLIG
jgi:hypothetical protein